MSGIQRFYCNHHGCDKSFQRREHLKRHSLNHTNQTILCPRCQKVFYRNDLLQRHLILKHGIRKSSPNHGTASDKSPGQSDAGSNSTAEHISSERQDPDHNMSVQEMNDSMDHHIQPNQQQNLALVPDQGQSSHHSGGCSYQTPPSYERAPILSVPSIGRTTALPSAPPECPDGFDIGNFSIQSANATPHMDWLFQLQPEFPSGVVPGQPNAHTVQPLQPAIPTFGPSTINNPTQLDFEMYTNLLSHVPTRAEFSFLIATPELASRLIENAIAHLNLFAPFFHSHTRNINFLPTDMCASLLAIGLLISHYKGAHELGCILLPQLRASILKLINKPIGYPQMWILETMFLVEYAGMFFGDRADVEASDIIHGAVVAIGRRLRIAQSVKLSSAVSPDPSLQQTWYDWAKKESLNRLAYCIFMSDVQHAVFFGHVRPVSSPLGITLELPCDDALWNAPSAEEWEIRLRESNSSSIKFNEIYHSLTLNETHNLKALSSKIYSNFLLLTAFSSLALSAKKQTKDPFWNASQAENCVKFAQDTLYGIITLHPSCTLRTSSHMTYHLTAISLCTTLDHLETATNVGYSRAGTTPAEETRLATMRLLTREKVTTEAANHAVELLRLYVGQRSSSPNQNPNPFDGVLESSPFETTALYFGVLTLWAYLYSQGFDSETSTYSFSQPEQRGMVPILDDLSTAINAGDMHGCVKFWREIVPPVTLRLTEKKGANAREYATVLKNLAASLV
ncbi:fungal-specific transcription factor domain-containing protein [Talaromyces proteolyticus]|uniref:Fungal-specific transcription factor domain-containing protein n=1 Tax=Talaromyces proteolyticus TaxID=1131652 RepID=A0AAD4L400_9EURO|nr:fungal-specific transcription factor domain-containing protein [Talaromyces proteolyticus]KAH8703798.1 fungal-specific transcription factor domain-containing protein [Talaromyces proteolyticus]